MILASLDSLCCSVDCCLRLYLAFFFFMTDGALVCSAQQVNTSKTRLLIQLREYNIHNTLIFILYPFAFSFFFQVDANV